MDRAAVAVARSYAVNFRRRLLRWYEKHQRKLPWRGARNPYNILVSEVMLQQTRVAVVEKRYQQFVRQFPTVETLARSREQTVLAAWSGLGYYRRARNLHAAAKEITAAKQFPETAEALRQLPGIGRYTANAVASIAFGEPVAVVDGNVKRVLERVFAAKKPTATRWGDARYWELAELLLDPRRAGDFNQAMMELGALVCLPGQPLCQACPVAAGCATRGPAVKKQRPGRRKAVLHYTLVRKNGAVLLQQRSQQSSLMPGMWELPQLVPDRYSVPLLKLRHSITTTDYTIFVHAGENTTAKYGRWVSLTSAKRRPLTGLARKILERTTDV